MNKPIDMKKLMERLENINEEDFSKDTHIYALAQAILTQVNSSAVEKDSRTYEALLAKHIDNVTNMIRNDISHIREADRAFSESINETTAEQYEVMLDMAGELGQTIAVNAYDLGEAAMMKHLVVAAKHMNNAAHKYRERKSQ